MLTGSPFFSSLLSSLLTQPTAVHLCHNGAPAENGSSPDAHTVTPSHHLVSLTTNHSPPWPFSQPMAELAAAWRWSGAERGARRDCWHFVVSEVRRDGLMWRAEISDMEILLPTLPTLLYTNNTTNTAISTTKDYQHCYILPTLPTLLHISKQH